MPVAPFDSTVVAIDVRDEVYSFALGLLVLRPPALDDLTRRALTTESIRRWRFGSLPRKGADLAAFNAQMLDRFGESHLRVVPGFSDKNGRLTFACAVGERDGYVVPFIDECGRVTGFQTRMLSGRVRYMTPRGTKLSAVYHVAGQRAATLHLVEGGLKTTVSAETGGLWCFGVAGQSLAASHIDVLRALAPERIAVALDRENNIATEQARDRWLRDLFGAGFSVCEAVWEQ